MTKPIGRPRNPIRDRYRRQFGLTKRQTRILTNKFMRQLCLCADDEARRLLLGVSR
jgi:hypothetical protein